MIYIFFYFNNLNRIIKADCDIAFNFLIKRISRLIIILKDGNELQQCYDLR